MGKKKDFRGLQEIDPDEPVVNVSYYEADAYARWAGKRLPTEAEWEKAASWNEELQRKTLYPWGDENPAPEYANLLESYLWGPAKIGSYPKGRSYYGCHQMIGDVWEWTSSEYVLYPGFQSKFPEYTDKWAINQKVLRGGCFATPSKQIRNSYRNYFKPHERILFAGFRCAKLKKETCEHVANTNDGVQPKTTGCEECEQQGRRNWVALRLCLTCGHVGCCDSSPGMHATNHFKHTGHPVMIALPNRLWKWCYVHEMYA
jgi:hypothetical protein